MINSSSPKKDVEKLLEKIRDELFGDYAKKDIAIDIRQYEQWTVQNSREKYWHTSISVIEYENGILKNKTTKHQLTGAEISFLSNESRVRSRVKDVYSWAQIKAKSSSVEDLVAAIRKHHASQIKREKKKAEKRSHFDVIERIVEEHGLRASLGNSGKITITCADEPNFELQFQYSKFEKDPKIVLSLLEKVKYISDDLAFRYGNIEDGVQNSLAE